MESLSEKLKQVGDESFETWFERWYKEVDLENTLIVSAKKGFRGFNINVECEEKYVQRRFLDSRFIPKLKERLGEGIKVSWEYRTMRGLFGGEIREDYISISW